MDRLRDRTTLKWGETAHENVIRCSHFESKTEPSVAKEQDYMWRGTPHRKKISFLDWVNNWDGDIAQHRKYTGRGGHRTYFLNGDQ